MNIENPAKELLQRYLRAVARHLPLSKRSDISNEIESMILDICEERYNDVDVDEKRMESVLVELGKPSSLAAKYKEENPIIGPKLMPIFKLVLLIVCLVTTIVSLLNFALSVSDMTAAEAGMYFLELFSSLTGAVGTIFIIFVILERAIKNKSGIEFGDDTWKISDLPELKEKVPVKGEIVAGLIFSIIFIIAINLFIDRIGIYSLHDEGGYTYTPILTDTVKNLLPLFSLRIALGAAVLLPLIAGEDLFPSVKKNYYYQLSQMGLTVFDIGIIILLLSRGPGEFLILDAFTTTGVEGLPDIMTKIFFIVLILLLALSGWNLIKRTLAILPKGRV